jgi:hypothetical protein
MKSSLCKIKTCLNVKRHAEYSRRVFYIDCLGRNKRCQGLEPRAQGSFDMEESLTVDRDSIRTDLGTQLFVNVFVWI